jgi:glutamate N-acetyltransferase/amino-acid N-acetyltransferase
VAGSQLVQCSLYGADPYWGRVLSELGASGVWFDPEHVDIAYNEIVVCRDGVAFLHDERAIEDAMARREITITCDLHQGMGRAAVRCTDLTHAYVDENMGTS